MLSLSVLSKNIIYFYRSHPMYLLMPWYCGICHYDGKT